LAEIINPFILYAGVALGALGVLVAMPRRRVSPQAIGGLIAAVSGGVVLIGLGLAARGAGALPNLYFYVFALLALGGCLRVITHPRPVYAALYFILTILSSAGLYILLSAEFMAFALVIIYAGAILITYLFVIMLATQAPSEEEVDRLAEYDTVSREPAAAVVAGFTLLAVLSTMLFSGASGLVAPGPEAAVEARQAVLGAVPGRVERAMRREGLIQDDERIVRIEPGAVSIDAGERVARVGVPTVADPASLDDYRGVR